MPVRGFTVDDLFRLLNLYFFIVVAIGKDFFVYFSRTFWVFKIFSFLVSVFLIFAIINITRKTSSEMTKLRSLELQDFLVIKPKLKSRTVKAWESVKFYLKSENQNDLKLAVIEADNIFDVLIKTLGYKGKNLEERLARIKPEQFSNLADLGRAHDIVRRMRIEEEIQITHQGAKSIVEVYQKTFEEAGVINKE